MRNVTPARPGYRGSGRKKHPPSDPFTLLSRSLKVNENISLRGRPHGAWGTGSLCTRCVTLRCASSAIIGCQHRKGLGPSLRAPHCNRLSRCRHTARGGSRSGGQDRPTFDGGGITDGIRGNPSAWARVSYPTRRELGSCDDCRECPALPLRCEGRRAAAGAVRPGQAGRNRNPPSRPPLAIHYMSARSPESHKSVSPDPCFLRNI